MAKTDKEIENALETAQALLNQRSLAVASGSRTDPLAVEKAEAQKTAFVNHFQGWSSDDLLKLQSAMLKDFDAQLSSLQEQGNSQRGTPTRNTFDTKMKNVFQNLVTTMNAVRKNEGETAKVEIVEDKPAKAQERKAEAVSPAVAQQPAVARENRLVAAARRAAARIQAVVDRVKERVQRKQEASPVASTPDPVRQAKIDAAVLAWAEGTSEKAVDTLEKSIDQTTAKIERTMDKIDKPQQAALKEEQINDDDIDALVADLGKMPEPEQSFDDLVAQVDKDYAAAMKKKEASSKFDMDQVFDEMVEDGKIDPNKAAPPQAEQTVQEYSGEPKAKPTVDVVPPVVAPKGPMATSAPPAPAKPINAKVAAAFDADMAALDAALGMIDNGDAHETPAPAQPPVKPQAQQVSQLSTAAQKTQAWQNIKAVTGAGNENKNVANKRPLPPPPPLPPKPNADASGVGSGPPRVPPKPTTLPKPLLSSRRPGVR